MLQGGVVLLNRVCYARNNGDLRNNMVKYYWRNRRLVRIRFRKASYFRVQRLSALRRNNPLRGRRFRFPHAGFSRGRPMHYLTRMEMFEQPRTLAGAIHEAGVARAAAAGAAEGAVRSMTPVEPSMERERAMTVAERRLGYVGVGRRFQQWEPLATDVAGGRRKSG